MNTIWALQTTCGDFKGALQNLERAAERLRGMLVP